MEQNSLSVDDYIYIYIRGVKEESFVTRLPSDLPYMISCSLYDFTPPYPMLLLGIFGGKSSHRYIQGGTIKIVALEKTT